ncbi:YkgJ family cysteine cluster protein [Chloroflexota bacterium]
MLKSWKEALLKEYPRLAPESKFRFSCQRGLSCFTKCCADVNIFLTPYDVLRMEKALNLSSGEFLEKYTVAPFMTEEKLPLVLLKMQSDDRKSCPFIASEGCAIYEDRPWSCRMFPLGIASSKTTDRPDSQEFCFIVDEGFSCLGFKEDKEWTVADWRRDQGIDIYDKKCEPYREITMHPLFSEGNGIGPAKTMVFYLTCYDLDRFRELILKSSFFSRFEVAEEVVEKIKTDDEALLNFGYDWLRFSLFGENTLKVKAEVLEEKKKTLFKTNSKRKANEKHRKHKFSK